MGHAHIDFVEQARLQSLLDGASPVQGNIFLACKLPGFGNRALDALGDKVILRLALFQGFASLRLQDNHWAGKRCAIRHDPPLLILNLMKASVSHNHYAALVELIAYDLIEMFHSASHPGEDF